MKFDNKYVSGNITIKDNKVSIKGTSKNASNKITIVAANPPDKLGNYSGTNLPFPSVDIAFENTKNIHKINGSSFNVEFDYPNSYYNFANCGDKVSPAIYFIDNANNENAMVELPDNCNLKTLVNRNKYHDPSFYDSKYHVLPVATAEKSMYNYANYKIINNKA